MSSIDIFAKFLELYPEFQDKVSDWAPFEENSIKMSLSDGSGTFEFTYVDEEHYELILHAEYPKPDRSKLLKAYTAFVVAAFLAVIFWNGYQIFEYVSAIEPNEPTSTTAPIEPTEESTEEPTITPTETIPEPTETQPTEVPSEPPSEPETTESVPNVDLDDLELLACAIYTEVGGNCEDCLRYCGDVILNRVDSSRFPNTIYEVLTQPGQYAKFKNGVSWPSRASNPNEAESVERAYRIARELLEGKHSELYGSGYIWQATFKQGTEGFWCCTEYYGKS